MRPFTIFAVTEKMTKVQELSLSEIKQETARGAGIIDIRPYKEMEEQVVPGALRIPAGPSCKSLLDVLTDEDRRYLFISDKAPAADITDSFSNLCGYLDASSAAFDELATGWLISIDEEEFGLDVQFGNPQLIDARLAPSGEFIDAATGLHPASVAEDASLLDPKGEYLVLSEDGSSGICVTAQLRDMGFINVRNVMVPFGKAAAMAAEAASG